MELLKKVTLEINKEINRKIKAKQNDTARYLLFTIVDNGVPFSLQGKEVKVFAVKPDGKLVYNACQITNSTNGEGKLNLTSQMLAVPGTLKAELVISEGNNILSTIPFEIEVIKSLRDDSALESTNEFSALTDGLLKLDEWDKTFKETSGKIEEKYAERLNNVSLQLSKNTNVIDTIENIKEEQFKRNFYINRNTYGTFDNACVGGFIANSKDRPAVLGILPENDDVLATYDNRDSVGLYVSNSTNDNNIFEFETANYTVDTIELPILFDTSGLKIGMIIDTKHDPKFSAIIKEINGNILSVYNWYKKGNTEKGQVPPSGVGGYINNTTKIWGQNLNIFLMQKDKICAGTAVEIGVFNYQNKRDFVDGYDTISMGNQNCDTAYKARALNNTVWKKGFEALNCEVGFYSEKANSGSWIKKARDYGHNVENTPIAYISKGDSNQISYASQNILTGETHTIRNNGNMNFLAYDTQIVDSKKTINLTQGGFVFLRNECVLPAPSSNTGKTITLHNVSSGTLTVEGRVQSGSKITSGLFLKSSKTVMLISDGNAWHILNFGDSFSLPS